MSHNNVFSSLEPMAVIMVVHYVQMSSLKPLGQSKEYPLIGRGNHSLYNWSGSHDQDGGHFLTLAKGHLQIKI